MNGNKYIAELEGVMSSYRRVLGIKVDLIPIIQRPTPKTHQLTLESVSLFNF